MGRHDSTDAPYVVVIPSKPVEVVGIFGSQKKAESWAVGHQLISWWTCPVLRPEQGDVVAPSLNRLLKDGNALS